MAEAIKNVNVIVAVGSVDGVIATSACIRNSRNSEALQVYFTQAHEVNNIDPCQWPANSQVGFIDIAVNNDNRSKDPQKLTIDFVKKIINVGHKILFIADEHDKIAWKNVFTQCGLDIIELAIKPKNRDKHKSTCTILKKALESSADAYTLELLAAGDQADQMKFDQGIAKIFNACIKFNLRDNANRLYIANYMARHEITDESSISDPVILTQLKDYNLKEANKLEILKNRQDLGDGIFLYNCQIGSHDASAIFDQTYKLSSIVILSHTEIVVGNQTKTVVSIGTNRDDLNVLKIIQDAGIEAGGFTKKANLALEKQEAAITAVRRALIEKRT